MLIEKFELEVELEEVDIEGSIECGFRKPWMSGDLGPDVSFEMLTGVGSRWITISTTEGEKRRYFRIDGEKLFVAALEAAGLAPQDGEGAEERDEKSD